MTEDAAALAGRHWKISASYVIGGWSETAGDAAELLAAIERGLEMSPIAEVSVQIVFPKAVPHDRSI